MMIDGAFRGDDCGCEGSTVWVDAEGDVEGRDDVVETIARTIGELKMMSRCIRYSPFTPFTHR